MIWGKLALLAIVLFELRLFLKKRALGFVDIRDIWICLLAHPFSNAKLAAMFCVKDKIANKFMQSCKKKGLESGHGPIQRKDL